MASPWIICLLLIKKKDFWEVLIFVKVRCSSTVVMFLPIDCFASCLASLTHALGQIKHALRLWDYIHTLLHCFWFISVACLCRLIHCVPFAKLATGPSHVIKLPFFFRTLMYYYSYCFVFSCTTLFL